MNDFQQRVRYQDMQRGTPTMADAYAQQGEAFFQQPQPPNGGGAGAAAGEMFDDASKIAVGFAAVKAGQNHYNQTGDLGQALQQGAVAYVRWMVFFFAMVLWTTLILLNAINGGLASGMRGDANQMNSHLLSAAYLLGITPFLFGVNWCRNIDFCLFRRGLIYRLYAPIAQVIEWVPTWVLYVLLLVPVVL